jgi:hypothetical protein
MKVYCGYCKYYRIGEYRDYCKSNPELKDSPIRRYKEHAEAERKNRNNDCGEYRKTWWKLI